MPVITILGMHRSGTSLVAHWLNVCGVDMGKNLLVANDNPYGHYEDKYILNFHKELLKLNNYDDSGLKLNALPKINIKNNLNDLDLFISKKQGLWGWKDPRTILFFNFWKWKIPQLYAIGVFRNYIDVVSSLISRDKMKAKYPTHNFFKKIRWSLLYNKHNKKLNDHYLKQWIIYNTELINLKQKYPNILLFDIASIISDKNSLINVINKSFSLNLSPIPLFTIFDEKKFSKNKSLVFSNDLKILANEIHFELKSLSVQL